MTDRKPRGRPRSTGTKECARCRNLVPKLRAHWPDGPICGACFTRAARTYGICAHCAADRLLPGVATTGELICRDCAGITTNMTCDNCGREAERLRRGHCARCVLTHDLEELLKPNNPPDLRIKRLISEFAAVPRPESIITWMRNPATTALLVQIGNRDLALNHEAFDALPESRSLEHLRELLVHHRMMSDRGDPRLARFEKWLEDRLAQWESVPSIHAPIEQFARWHHLRRLREGQTVRNMDNATRNAKQEITETGKFLQWLLDAYGTVIDSVRQEHLDIYLSEGSTTRHSIRNFIQWRAKTGIAKPFRTGYRTPKQTPLAPSHQRLELIRTVIESDHVILPTRMAALILLLYGIPIRRIAELMIDDIHATPAGTTMSLGATPAPIPEPLLPFFHEFLADRGNQRTMNHGSVWLFPGTRAGQHISEQVLMHRIRGLGIDIQAIRNAALHDLTKEIDAASLADLLGYSANVMNIHAARAAVPMASYPSNRRPMRR